MQFKAGYIIDGIANLITKYKSDFEKNNSDETVRKKEFGKINGLLQYASCFDVKFPHNEHNIDFKNLNPVLATLNNIITRGLPTKAPISVEEKFVKIGLTKQDDKNDGKRIFPVINKSTINYDSVFELLHIIEPNLTFTKSNYYPKLGSHLEWKFISNHQFVQQLLQSQRDFRTINSRLGGGRTVDFSFTSPYLHYDEQKDKYINHSRIFEVDGQHHLLDEYKYYDSFRDDLAAEAGFETIRTDEFKIGNGEVDFESLINRTVYKNFKNNYEKNIEDFKDEYALIFIPLAVARIQKTLIEYFLYKKEILEKPTIAIAIIERDLPCGALAIDSLKDYITNINLILEDANKLKFPEIKLYVFKSNKWNIKDALHDGAELQEETFFKNNKFDIVIDHCILRRSEIYKETDFQQHQEQTIKIRSAHYFDTSFGNARRVYCADLLKYKSLVKKQDDGSYKSIADLKIPINFFIQNIFRKEGFRDGQLPIISRALQQLPVIGLLPTGGGKSLTYQLPALMQPGLCLIVDPIKSLMEDQVRVLKENWIDCCDFINSNLDRTKKAEKFIDFMYGESMFFFVSPERLVMKDFRKLIETINKGSFGLAFSYCVVDEVHCLSEWGHDFRTTYLMLGENAQKYCYTRNLNQKVILVGLTATASFDVLADIERELKIKHDDVSNAIIMIENTIRPELFFRIIDVTGKSRINELNNDFIKMGENLAKYNADEVLKQSLIHHYFEFENEKFISKEKDNYIISKEGESKINERIEKLKLEADITQKTTNELCSIVFCPTKSGGKGVDDVFNNLTSDTNGFFYASDDNNQNRIIQQHFKDFVSVSQNIKHMICTKAFGMGIDKDNIRSTYHFYYSSSLESLVQEVGRSGRDGKIAEAVLLVSKNENYRVSHNTLLKNKIGKIDPIQNLYIRKQLRFNFVTNGNYKDYNSIVTLKQDIENIYLNLNLDDTQKKYYSERLFIETIREDRNIHDYLYSLSYKGLSTEITQLEDLLIKGQEFYFESILNQLEKDYNANNGSKLSFKCSSNSQRIYVNDNQDYIGRIDITNANNVNPNLNACLISVSNFLQAQNNGQVNLFPIVVKDIKILLQNQTTLENAFNITDANTTFKFNITSVKEYLNPELEICLLLNLNPLQQINPPNYIATYQEKIKDAIGYSIDIDDFLLMLEEIQGTITKSQLTTNRKQIEFIYNRNRDEGDTGKLIYRMHSMGFLVDYEID